MASLASSWAEGVAVAKDDQFWLKSVLLHCIKAADALCPDQLKFDQTTWQKMEEKCSKLPYLSARCREYRLYRSAVFSQVLFICIWLVTANRYQYLYPPILTQSYSFLGKDFAEGAILLYYFSLMGVGVQFPNSNLGSFSQLASTPIYIILLNIDLTATSYKQENNFT